MKDQKYMGMGAMGRQQVVLALEKFVQQKVRLGALALQLLIHPSVKFQFHLRQVLVIQNY